MFHFHDRTSLSCTTLVISSNYFFVMISYILSHFPRFEHPQTFSALFLCTFLKFRPLFFLFLVNLFLKTLLYLRCNKKEAVTVQYLHSYAKIHSELPAAMGFLPAGQNYVTVSAVNAQTY